MNRLRRSAVLRDDDAWLFDLDGVLTPTAEVHMRAWAVLFDEVFEAHDLGTWQDADYFELVDGKPRYDGVANALTDRGLRLPWGDPGDPPEAQTVCGLGNRKNLIFQQVLDEEGVTPYPGSVALLDALAVSGIRVAVVSSSRNAPAVLAAAGLADRFTVVVDGGVAAATGLPGKPAPDTFVHAAGMLGVPVGRAVVVEDAVVGVRAGAAGGFGAVIGVDRGVGRTALLDAGASIVVSDLAELLEA